MNYNKAIEDIINIEKVLDLDFNLVNECITCDDAAVRENTIKALEKFTSSKKVQEVVLNAMRDKIYGVRISAYNFLEKTKNPQHIDALVSLIEIERSQVAKAVLLNTIISLANHGEVSTDSLMKIQENYGEETSLKLNIDYLSLFYTLSKNLGCLVNSLFHINDEDPSVRTTVINSVANVIREDDAEYFVTKLYGRLAIEDNNTIRNLIQNTIEKF